MVSSLIILTRTYVPEDEIADYIYLFVYQIDITDDFNGKGRGITRLYFRIEPVDKRYEMISTWKHFITVDHEDEGLRFIAEYFPGYCFQSVQEGDAFKLGIKAKHGRHREIQYINIIYLNDNEFHWTEPGIECPYKFDGTIKIQYKIEKG
jgi:hypothetical protein